MEEAVFVRTVVAVAIRAGPRQQRMRDVMCLEIGDGTAQIMKLIIARGRIGRAAVQYAELI